VTVPIRSENLHVDARGRAAGASPQLLEIGWEKDPNIQSQISNVLRSEALSTASSLTSGDQSGVEPPGPIPNPEVKRPSANGSETTGLVRVGRRQVNAPIMET
jgi:hypothetical protein